MGQTPSRVCAGLRGGGPMNRRGRRPGEATVHAPARVTWIAAAIAAVGSSACIEIEGGAVELSWSLRSFAGESVGSCEDAFLEEVRVCWQGLGDAGGAQATTCASARSQAFSCSDETGVSGFEIEPGPTAFWVEPL